MRIGSLFGFCTWPNRNRILSSLSCHLLAQDKILSCRKTFTTWARSQFFLHVHLHVSACNRTLPQMLIYEDFDAWKCLSNVGTNKGGLGFVKASCLILCHIVGTFPSCDTRVCESKLIEWHQGRTGSHTHKGEKCPGKESIVTCAKVTLSPRAAD